MLNKITRRALSLVLAFITVLSVAAVAPMVASAATTSDFRIEMWIKHQGGEYGKSELTVKNGDVLNVKVQFTNTGKADLAETGLCAWLCAGVKYVDGSTYAKKDGKTYKCADGIFSYNGLNIAPLESGKSYEVAFQLEVTNAEYLAYSPLLEVGGRAENVGDGRGFKRAGLNLTQKISPTGLNTDDACYVNYDVEMWIKLEGGEYGKDTLALKNGDEVYVKTQFTNTGNQDFEATSLKAWLPYGSEYVIGSTYLQRDEKTYSVSDAIVSEGGIGGAEWALKGGVNKQYVVFFKLKVTDLELLAKSPALIIDAHEQRANGGSGYKNTRLNLTKLAMEPAPGTDGYYPPEAPTAREPLFSADMQVSRDGAVLDYAEYLTNAKEGDVIAVLVKFINEDSAAQKDVTAKVDLPNGTKYLSGTTVIYDGRDSDIFTKAEDTIATTGLILKPNSHGVTNSVSDVVRVAFSIRVTDETALSKNPDLRLKITTSGGEKEDTARLLTHNATAAPSAQGVTIDGKSVAFDAYSINGNNYFKLRDLAYALNGTAAQFDVVYDEKSNIGAITVGSAYTPIGGEMAVRGTAVKQAILSTMKLTVNGKEADILAYNIGDNNYAKIADLGKAIGFDVKYCSSANAVLISTK